MSLFDESELSPAELASVGIAGDAATNNKLIVSSSSNLALSGLYSGPAYTLAGPANVGSSPIQLGFRSGDRIVLKGATGTEPNHGRDLTLSNPGTFSVFEVLVHPDANEYEFTIIRRSM